jgi:ethanolamine permease
VAQERKLGSVTYQEVTEDYFHKRGLRRHARVWSLWALGVGAVISGDYYGWNFGLSTGGFGGLLIATAVIAVMYYGLCYSIAEMSPALPHTGGAYSFARSAMGPWGGFTTGLAENMEYVITPAVVVGAIGLLMQALVINLLHTGGTLAADGITVVGASWWNSEPVWWAVFYVIFVGVNIWGIEATMRFTVTITVLALGVLAVFYVSALVSGNFHPSLWFNIPDNWSAKPEDLGQLLPKGGGSFLPFGIGGVFKALPFAIWFYLAIEEVPLAAEESHDPRRDIPKGTVWGMHTLLIASIFTLFINSGLGRGAGGIGITGTPLFDGFKGIFGSGTAASLLALIGLVGLIASFFTIIFAYGRNTYSLSRAGYFPKVLSVTHPTRKTPHVALVAGAVVGYVVLLIVWRLQSSGAAPQVVAAVLNMAVFAAVISYALQCTSFVLLRRNLPNIDRPYRSKWGTTGAYVAGAIAVISLVSTFVNPDYRPGVYGVAIYYVLGLLYFAIAGRHRLVLSPEEEFALTRGERGIPEAGGYSTSRQEQETILGAEPRGMPPEAH